MRPGAPSEPNEYNFNFKRRGLFLLINNKNFARDTKKQRRDGSDVDAERLEERFQDLGFDVRRFDDVARGKMATLMYDGEWVFMVCLTVERMVGYVGKVKKILGSSRK